jgi:hypothetical protein
MTNLERVLKALSLQQPDIVPTFEINIDPKVRDSLLPDASYEDFVEFMDLDAAVYYDWAYDRYETLDEARGIIRDKFGITKQRTSEVDPMPIEAAIRSEKDLETYNPPDPDVPWKYEPLKAAVKQFKGKRAVIATVVDVFYMVNEIHMERFAIEPLQIQVAECRKHNIPCLKHTDGNIWSIFDMLIETGITGIHPIDPTSGMDIGEVKARYGDLICLIGNIDCGHLLTSGTTDEVRSAVKECISKAWKGGGFICTSSNSIHSGVRPENYIAMIEAIKEYGQYSLSS